MTRGPPLSLVSSLCAGTEAIIPAGDPTNILFELGSFRGHNPMPRTSPPAGAAFRDEMNPVSAGPTTSLDSSATPFRPLLSFFTGARNDSYMGNFRWRLETTINYLGASLRKLGREGAVEFVITDWGSEVPLHRVLNLTEEGRRVVRFILVPPAQAKLHQTKENDYPTSVIQNV